MITDDILINKYDSISRYESTFLKSYVRWLNSESNRIIMPNKEEFIEVTHLSMMDGIPMLNIRYKFKTQLGKLTGSGRYRFNVFGDFSSVLYKEYEPYSNYLKMLDELKQKIHEKYINRRVTNGKTIAIIREIGFYNNMPSMYMCINSNLLSIDLSEYWLYET